MIVGKTRKRREQQTIFRSGNAQVMLLALKAAGEAIDIPEGDLVIPFDPWYNAKADEQVICRVHRTGQLKIVRILRPIVENSLEPGIMAIAEKKSKLVDAVFQSIADSRESGDTLTGGMLTIEDIEMLLKPARARETSNT